MLGFSLYFEENSRVDLSAYQGFDMLFTSLHYPPSDKAYSQFLDLYQQAKEFTICVDINNQTLKDYPNLIDMGLILRLDFGFSAQEIADISQKSQISINASTVCKDFLEDLKDAMAMMENIIAIHNYYPLEFTGLSEEFFIIQNQMLKSYGIKLGGFVPGNDKLRGPVYKGLPTLEDDRYKSPYLTSVKLRREYGLDLVIVAEGIKEIDKLFISKFFKENIISLPVNMDYNYRDIKGITARPDISKYLIRNYREKLDVPPLNCTKFTRGDIAICNNLSGRYAGEIELVKEDLGEVENRNMIGQIDRDYIDILDYIRGDDEIEFYRG